MIAQVSKVQTQHDTRGIRAINNSPMVIKLVQAEELLKPVLGIAEKTKSIQIDIQCTIMNQ